ncbi:PAS domain-containing sensor histidine kinase [Flavobacterium sp. GT3R68]|uniref:PAS domain-containing sensor histidine kinase n=1 Tax=Flavobacterium sp. GT3R68 TaxID=2594437 RepID=UPI000F85D78E|nr:PAS domain-containing sensor histidine kinase [Flavobacterium sp. GT3R68]RTY90839.1 PAS domain-containing sensor histidine kinase [Flavobacterium sp. GSN2]TRW93831.1 PAS domain-containing sensor histidine kinase [Flavobacterium sp. GT3R68]
MINTIPKFSNIFDSLLEGVQIHDFNWRYTYVNDALVKYSNYSKEELLGYTMMEKYPGIEQTDLFKALQRCMNERTMEQLETEFVFPDGTPAFFELRIQPIPEGIFILSIDRTQQQKAKENLLQSEKKYRHLFDNSPIPMWIIDVKTLSFLDVNKMAIVQYGYTRDEFLSMSAVDIRPDEDKEQFEQLDRSLGFNALNYNRGIWDHRKKDGTVIQVEIIANDIIFEGIPARIILSNDVTERKMVEENLRKSESRLKESQALAHISNWEIDMVHDIHIWSDGFYKIFGINRNEAEPSIELFLSFVHHDDVDFVQKKMQEAFETYQDSSFNFCFIYKDGSIRYGYSEWKFEFNKKSRPIRIYGILQDVTESKMAELKLEQQNKELVKTNSELDRFVYSVSHDLRSPLTSMLGLITFIEEESKEPDTIEHANMIHTSILRLDRFIKNILLYSHNNRTGLEMEKIPLQKTIEEVVDALRSMKEGKGIHFEVNIIEEQPFYSDWQRFNTIMENLISNAIKYHKKEESGRYIKITGTSDREKLQIDIADNGIGIAPVYHDKIFDMFFRLSGKSTGSGIGLYIVKEIIEKLQGSIKVHSEEEKGTSFNITLKNLMP